MAFPLTAVLKSAPEIIFASKELYETIRKYWARDGKTPLSEKVENIGSLMEEQAKVIDDLAINNKNLVLAIRNTRIISLISLLIGITACILAIWL
ncbi:MAG: hypothetical protein KC588_17625 [Nitrospira sp.]|nr:hypothetical protein [Nitrospira sp.]